MMSKKKLQSVREVIKIGTHLENLINNLLKIGSKHRFHYPKLIKEIDLLSIEECEKRTDHIVGHLLLDKNSIADAIEEFDFFHKDIGWSIDKKYDENILKDGAKRFLKYAMDGNKNLNPILNKPFKIMPKREKLFGESFVNSKNSKPKFITSQQLQVDIKLLLSKIPHDITAIAGVARSGISVASMLSMYLHLPIISIRQTYGDVVDIGNGWRLGGNKHVNPSTKKVLVVDDTVMSGNSLKIIRPIAEKNFQETIFAAVYVNPEACVKPDIWAVDLYWPHLLEWNLFNSILSPFLACDFDGIFCNDCLPECDDDGDLYLDFIQNASPLYLPRKSSVPLIVTARIEKYREETEKWLNKYQIKYNKLIMHPAKTLQERRKDNICEYKASHFKEWAKKFKNRSFASPMFVESDDISALGISKIANCYTLCPSSGKIYGSL